MILSALLTSVGINFGLCLLFFTLYSILQKLPGNINFYAPHLVAEGKSQQIDHFNLERLLPSTGWVRSALNLSEEELLSTSGLDAMVFIRIFIFRLWIHFCAVYLFTGVVCIFFTLQQLESWVDVVKGGSGRKKQFYGDGILGKPPPFLNDVERLYTKLANLSLRKTNARSSAVDSWDYLELNSVFKNIMKMKLEDIEENMRLEESALAGKVYPLAFLLWVPVAEMSLAVGHSIRLSTRIRSLVHSQIELALMPIDIVKSIIELCLSTSYEVPAAFVSFKSQLGAAVAVLIQQSVDPTEWVTERAPGPNDVYWPFFSVSFTQSWICKLMVYVTYIVLTFLFLIPVVVVQGLTHLEQLEIWFPFLKGILRLTFIIQVITGYLPSLILQMFLSIVPPIMRMLSLIQGHISLTKIELSACTKMLWFTIWNIFFANVLSGSVFFISLAYSLSPRRYPPYWLKLFQHSKWISSVIDLRQASFFIAYVVTSVWTSLSSELFRLVPLIRSSAKRLLQKEGRKEGRKGVSEYLCMYGFLFFLCSSRMFMQANMEPVGFDYLFIDTDAYNCRRDIWSKKLPIASYLTIPLPMLILLFDAYCRKCFLPTFHPYPVECLVKKDTEDQNDPNMADFLDKLGTAYRDPALMPIHYSRGIQGQSSPLLHSDER
ncbi:CSC1/OSCA1-like, N-terminal transmembrane domain [Dillenia turbinata]|uniref:CSC1/OSCA1-like, N-terminal transmembrane domain n=1 Tax=Dillenia turbinata TaxID=194707 RepID=A0AAN8UK69_9MAGN